jgi:perosamine synthetase
VEQIESKITDRTKAILVVHIYGLPVDMDPVLDLCKKHHLILIEDAAEMHGQTYKGRKCGSFGDISIFSFYPNKHITTGEGGMILCNDETIAEKCRKLRNLAFEPKGRRFIHHELGWNYRMTNLQAALGLAQLEKIDEHIAKKREIGNVYLKLLNGIKGFQLPLSHTDYAENIYWVFGMLADTEELAERIQQKLTNHKIGTRPFFWCMHEQPVFQKMGLFINESYPVAEAMARKGFYIPSGLGLTTKEAEYVCKIIQS